MSDAGWALQQAVYSALNGDATLGAMITGVFDIVPEGSNTKFPYVTVGEVTEADQSTMGQDGQTHTITIHSWSRYRGRKEIKQIMAEVYRILHRTALTISGATHAGTLFEFSDVLLDSDGITQHGVQRFRVVTFSQ